jgi:hypothetical protein
MKHDDASTIVSEDSGADYERTVSLTLKAVTYEVQSASDLPSPPPTPLEPQPPLPKVSRSIVFSRIDGGPLGLVLVFHALRVHRSRYSVIYGNIRGRGMQGPESRADRFYRSFSRSFSRRIRIVRWREIAGKVRQLYRPNRIRELRDFPGYWRIDTIRRRSCFRGLKRLILLSF